jgi:hypothetical protein
MTSDIKPPIRDEAIAPPELVGRPLRWRMWTRGAALLLLLGAGWVAGIKTHESVDVAQLSTSVVTNVAGIRAYLDKSASGLVTWMREQIPDGAITPDEHRSTLAERAALSAGAADNVERINLELSQLRASSEAAFETLRGTTDRLESAVDSSQQRLLVKLDDLSDRLKTLERNQPPAAGPVLTKLEQLDERLDRIERSAAVALRPTQPPAVADSTTPAAESKTPVRASAPAEKSEAPAEAKKIAGWFVREVINGTAILQGPGGVVGASTGQVVPGLGRVQSIARQSGRWVVATNKGLITTR